MKRQWFDRAHHKKATGNPPSRKATVGSQAIGNRKTLIAGSTQKLFGLSFSAARNITGWLQRMRLRVRGSEYLYPVSLLSKRV